MEGFDALRLSSSGDVRVLGNSTSLTCSHGRIRFSPWKICSYGDVTGFQLQLVFFVIRRLKQLTTCSSTIIILGAFGDTLSVFFSYMNHRGWWTAFGILGGCLCSLQLETFVIYLWKLVWNVWLARNDTIFNANVAHVQAIILKVDRMLLSWFSNCADNTKGRLKEPMKSISYSLDFLGTRSVGGLDVASAKETQLTPME